MVLAAGNSSLYPVRRQRPSRPDRGPCLTLHVAYSPGRARPKFRLEPPSLIAGA